MEVDLQADMEVVVTIVVTVTTIQPQADTEEDPTLMEEVAVAMVQVVVITEEVEVDIIMLEAGTDQDQVDMVQAVGEVLGTEIIIVPILE